MCELGVGMLRKGVDVHTVGCPGTALRQGQEMRSQKANPSPGSCQSDLDCEAVLAHNAHFALGTIDQAL